MSVIQCAPFSYEGMEGWSPTLSTRNVGNAPQLANNAREIERWNAQQFQLQRLMGLGSQPNCPGEDYPQWMRPACESPFQSAFNKAVRPDYAQQWGEQPYVQNLQDSKLRVMLSKATLGGDERLFNVSRKASMSMLEPADIKELQTVLMARGLDLGPAGVDGKFGPATHRALQQHLMMGN